MDWKKLTSLLTGKPAAKGKVESAQEDDIARFMNVSGRVDYAVLTKLASSRSSHVFSKFIRRPVLAGVGIKKGKLIEKEKGESHLETMMFQSTSNLQKSAQEEESSLDFAVYPLIKGQHSRSKFKSLFFIGRVEEVETDQGWERNDMIMPDYSVSKRHARLLIHESGYYVRDMGSTNGVKINDAQIKPGQDYGLEDGDVITMGRFKFTFLTPLSLFEKLTGNRPTPEGP